MNRHSGLLVALLVFSFVSGSLAAQVHAAGSQSFNVFPQPGYASLFTLTQTCSLQEQVTANSISIKMGTCTPEFADVNARDQQFYVDSVTWNAVYNGTNTAPTTTNPLNEMVGFLTDDIVNFNKHEIGIICKLDEGLFVGYYQDHTVGGAGFQTTGSLGSCVGGSTLTPHNFSISINYDGSTNTFVYAVDSAAWTLNYTSPTNYSRLSFWWWMTVHRNGSWTVPTGTETIYNSVSIGQDLLPGLVCPNGSVPAGCNQRTRPVPTVALSLLSPVFPLAASFVGLVLLLPYALSNRRASRRHHGRQ